MQIPNTYAEWAKLLEELKKGTDDEAVLMAMRAGTLAWQSGVAERFTKRLTAVVNARMDQAQDQFSRTLQHGTGETSVVQGLLDLRRTFSFLKQVMSIPAIPAEYQETYAALVQEQADQIQKSLEDSAKSDHTGKLSGIVKNHRMNVL